MYKVLSGKEVSKAVLEGIKEKVSKMETKPHLAIVLVGSDPASEIYVKKKLEKAEAVGVKTTLKKMPEETSEEEVLSLIDELNKENETLTQQIERLESDPFYIEKKARDKMAIGKEGEIRFKVIYESEESNE